VSYLPDVDADLDLLDRDSKRGACSVVEGHDCEAAPGLTARTSCKCFACGDFACRACSLVTKYHLRYGNQRVCFNCIRDGCLGTVARGQMTLLGSLVSAQRAHGQVIVERAIRAREADRARRRGQ
jgi:hypothetical protein